MSGRRVAIGLVVVGLCAALGWLVAQPDERAPRPDAPAASTRKPARDAPPERDEASADARPTTAAPDARVRATPRGATVRGVVIDPHGVPRAGLALALVDRQGARVDEVTSAADGSYELVDEGLTAARLEVAAPDAGERQRALAPPLADGEVRVLDLVVGRTRVVRGFVLDMRGDPLAGVTISLLGMDFRRAWRTTTDRGGGFVFAHAPTAALRVEATRADLGKDAEWVAPGEREALLELVLEPSAQLTVLAAAGVAPGARVRIRCVEEGCFGADRQWLGPAWSGSAAAREHDAAMKAFTIAFARRFYPELLPEEPEALPLPTLELLIEDRVGALTPEARAALTERLAGPEAAAFASENLPAPPAAAPDRWSTVAEGRPGETFTVAADLVHTIDLVAPDATATPCGTVRPGPGEALAVTCGATREAVVEGQVVDAAGRPLSGVPLVLHADAPTFEARTTSGAEGRFRLAAKVDRIVLAALDPGSPELAGGRRNIAVVPGDTRDIGAVVVIAGVDRPERWPTSTHDGTGGLVAEAAGGVRIDGLEDLGPLALAGVEEGDLIVRIDEAAAAELVLDEVLQRLRGPAGTAVTLRIRSQLGELYDVNVERAEVPPPHELLMQRFGEGPYPPGY